MGFTYLSMYLAIKPSEFNIHYMMLSEKTKNNVMEGGDFYRLYYSDALCNSNGLYIYFSFNNISIEKYFNKIKCIFSLENNREIIHLLKKIEYSILHHVSFGHKDISYRISEQLDNKYIKIFTDKHIDFGKNKKLDVVLKISGIWNNYNACGLTFRFYVVNHPLSNG